MIENNKNRRDENKLWRNKNDMDYQTARCRVVKVDFSVNVVERVILIFMLGMILYMTIK